jgi:type IV pilus assembly protein PilF
MDGVPQGDLGVLFITDFHVVAKGENLYRISLLYNIKMQRLLDWNSLVDASAIFDGKKLSLVAPSVIE